MPIEIGAYVRGTVLEVLEGEGVIVRARGAFVQGIFGVGGERQGEIRGDEGFPLSRQGAGDSKKPGGLAFLVHPQG